MSTQTSERRENQLLYCVPVAFFVSGAASQPLGSFIPFLRDTYGLSYDLSGVLLSCQSVGNLAAVLLSGFLPLWLGRRRAVLLTAVWMTAAYLIFAAGLGSAPLLPRLSHDGRGPGRQRQLRQHHDLHPPRRQGHPRV